MCGRPEKAFLLLEKAIEIDPKSTGLWVPYYWGGIAHLLLGQGHDAVQWLKRSLEADATNVDAIHKYLASAYASIGDMDRANGALREYLRRVPGQSITTDRQHRVSSDVPTFLTQYQRVIDGLRKAGMPER